MIQVVGGCKLLEIRKQLQKLMARGCQMALKLMAYQLHINPLKPELNPICYLLALLRAHHFLHVSRIRVKLLTFRLLM